MKNNIANGDQAVDLSETRPDPNVKIEDHDMNTWGIVSVGSGYDDKFKKRNRIRTLQNYR